MSVTHTSLPFPIIWNCSSSRVLDKSLALYSRLASNNLLKENIELKLSILDWIFTSFSFTPIHFGISGYFFAPTSFSFTPMLESFMMSSSDILSKVTLFFPLDFSLCLEVVARSYLYNYYLLMSHLDFGYPFCCGYPKNCISWNLIGSQ